METVALGDRDPLVADRGDCMTDLPAEWITATLGHRPRDAALFERVPACTLGALSLPFEGLGAAFGTDEQDRWLSHLRDQFLWKRGFKA